MNWAHRKADATMNKNFGNFTSTLASVCDDVYWTLRVQFMSFRLLPSSLAHQCSRNKCLHKLWHQVNNNIISPKKIWNIGGCGGEACIFFWRVILPVPRVCVIRKRHALLRERKWISFILFEHHLEVPAFSTWQVYNYCYWLRKKNQPGGQWLLFFSWAPLTWCQAEIFEMYSINRIKFWINYYWE